jgi:PhzF family phenazine biosynthesis protein
MELEIFQIDAFADRVFSGNPAAVVPLKKWLPDATLQAIATENNLSETAFYVKNGEYYDLRWFTPETEVDLCGHATLAAAHVLFEFKRYKDDCIVFETKSGRLFVDREDGLLSLDFPAWTPKSFPVPESLVEALGARPRETYATRDILAVFESEEEVRALKPRMRLLAEFDVTCVICAAPGRDHDFISRSFAPAVGIPEDPVTGSSHCTLIPYWSKRLNKTSLTAFQASARGGELFCEDMGDRVKIAGRAACYMKGTAHLPD